MQRFCLTLDLKKDPQLISQYVEYHRAVWPEVLASLRASGIAQMEIFQLGARLCMVVEAEDDFTFERKSAMDAANETVQRWEQLMERFQDVEAAPPGEAKWKRMEPVFNLQEQLGGSRRQGAA